jgi:hypothetical protein
MSSTTREVHRFFSLFAAQAFIATLQVAQKSYRTLRVPRPKRGNPLYAVVIYG